MYLPRKKQFACDSWYMIVYAFCSHLCKTVSSPTYKWKHFGAECDLTWLLIQRKKRRAGKIWVVWRRAGKYEWFVFGDGRFFFEFLDCVFIDFNQNKDGCGAGRHAPFPPLFVTFSTLFRRRCLWKFLVSLRLPFGSILVAFDAFLNTFWITLVSKPFSFRTRVRDRIDFGSISGAFCYYVHVFSQSIS